ncbi:hypothetical protein [Bradyrhizobium sp. CB1015]|uniref:hypothetical protein n=1 Tax=Bradyrhizobium sp. CB1015 TaxID=2976822 RepID=UPI0021AAF068|nr:hypothetical protein [Bradyrhizobium sp. CB1015]UWU92201.1 hypothetical protein N2604_38295 [Bradyrhizobium sp. CB1015]
MRKLILIAAMSLLASQAHAGGSRSLSLAASNAGQQSEQPATATPVPAQTPQGPPTTNVPTATAPAASTAPAAAIPAATTSARPATASTTETAKPKRRQPSTEARVIRELHRHGIYW